MDTGNSDPLARLRQARATRTAAGLRRRLAVRSATDVLLDLASNDYLGLSRDERVTRGAVAAARQWGAGATGSRLVTGTTALHARLERELADFTGADAALVFSSGYLANLAAVATLAGALSGAEPRAASDTLIVSDAANHASLIDACRLSRAAVTVVPHADVDAVASALAHRRQQAALVVSDTVFSVTGDLAPVTALHRAARAHGALLVLDEAHAFGVVGPGGRGAAHAAGIAGEGDVVRTVTLSKSLAGQGGAVLGAAEVVDTLVDAGRAFIFDTGLAPPCAGSALAALAALREAPELGRRARTNTARLAATAEELGFEVSRPDAAVLRVVVGEPDAAVAAQRICADSGVRVGCFRPPSVPAGQSCLRVVGRATLTEDDFGVAARALAAARDHVRRTAGAGRMGS